MVIEVRRAFDFENKGTTVDIYHDLLKNPNWKDPEM